MKEKERGCGFRQPGGFYLVSDGSKAMCCSLPAPIPEACKCCGHEIAPTRSLRWVSADFIPLAGLCSSPDCTLSPESRDFRKFAVDWIGQQHYPTAAEFLREGERLGFSRRTTEAMALAIASDNLPVTILLAHQKGMEVDGETVPAVIAAFSPRVEYVIKGGESPQKMARLQAAGVVPVTVETDGEQLELALPAQEVDRVLEMSDNFHLSLLRDQAPSLVGTMESLAKARIGIDTALKALRKQGVPAHLQPFVESAYRAMRATPDLKKQ